MNDDERTARQMLASTVLLTDMDTIDAGERDHFRFLQQSIGQNFISVLNDPRESEGAQKGGWMSSAGGMMGSALSGVLFEKATAEPAARLSRIPTVSNKPVTDYMAALGGNYEAWALSKQQGVSKDVDSPSASPEQLMPTELFAPGTPCGYDVLRTPEVMEAVLPGVDDPYTSQVLMSKLEQLLKAVDAKLLTQVRHRSPQFFTALANFNSLKGTVTASLKHIATLRGTMAQAKEESVTSNLRILQLQTRLENQRSVLQLVQRVKRLQKLGEVLEGEASMGNHNMVLSVLTGELEAEGGAGLDIEQLRRVVCTAGTCRYIDTLRADSIAAANTELVELICVGLNGGPIGDSYPELVEEEALEEAKAVWVAKVEGLFALMISRGSGGVASLRADLVAFRDRVFKDVKRVVGSSIIKSMQILQSDPNLPPDELLKPAKLRELSGAHFGVVLEQLFQAVFHLYRRTHRVTMGVEEVVAESKLSGLDKKSVTELLTATRAGVVRMIQSRIVRMFDVRQEEHAAMSSSEILQLMRLSHGFIFDLDRLSPGATSAIRSTLATQAKGFFKKQHERQQNKLLQILLTEHWIAEQEVDSAFQYFADRLTCTDADSVAAAKRMSLTEPGCGVLPKDPDVTGNKPRIYVGKNSYTISQSILMLLRTLSEYEQHVFAMPFLAHEVSQRIHDLFKVYDGQTAALVLGAGARETAGLESITVAHLAVSSQCLGFLADFAPKFRARLEAVLPPNGTVFLKHLDRFSRDATNHRNEFYSKMVLMVKEGPSYAKAWKPANWMSEGTQGISSLLKELARILKKGGLEKILDKAQLRFVVYPVLYMYFLKIKSCISEMRNLDTDASLLAKVQQDLLHYKVNVENLGFSVLRSAVSDPSWLPDDDEVLPEGDDEVLALFLPEGSSKQD